MSKLRKIIDRITASADNRPAGGDKDPARIELTGTVELQAAAAPADGQPAKLPTFTIQAYNGGPMRVGYSFYPVILELSGMKASRAKLPILMNHDDARPVGQADKVTIDAKGVTLTGSLTATDGDAALIASHAKNGFEWQASIGATIDQREILEAGKTATVNGREVTGPLIIARRSTLVETSIVTIGADQATSASIAANAPGEHTMKFNEWLKANGITDFDSLSDPIKKQLQAAFDASQTNTAKPDTAAAVQAGAKPADTATAQVDIKAMVTDAITAARKEWEEAAAYNAAIDRITANHPDIRIKAMAEKWSREKAELEVLRAGRPQFGAMVNTGAGSQVPTTDLLTAALCQAGNLRTVEKQFDDKTLQAAHTKYRGNLGIKSMLLEAAWANGYQGRHFDHGGSEHAAILRAAFSTTSLPGILNNVANKFLLQGFNAVEQTWRRVSSQSTVNDFKTVTRYRLTGAMQFEEVGASGELKHGTVGEESYTNQADTYGIMFAITRRDQINDDLGAFTQVPQRIGRGGALKLNEVFWTEFLADHATFFNTDNSKLNYISGADTVMSVAGVAAAQTQFMRKKDANDKPLGLMPKLLLTPPEQLTAAEEVYKSLTVNTGGSSTKAQVANANTLAGRYEPVASQYLTSTLEWYMLADPMDLAMIDVAFLNGNQQPTIEQSEADFSTLGIQMRGFWDFGVNKHDYRAAVKSKGAA